MTAALTQAPKASVDLDALYAASNIGEILEQLDRELVGLVPVKSRIREIAALLLIDQASRHGGVLRRQALTVIIGISVPAHFDESRNEFVLDYPFPCQYDAAAKHWDFEGGEISWDTVFERWKARGPMNERYVEAVQRSHMDVNRLLEVA